MFKKLSVFTLVMLLCISNISIADSTFLANSNAVTASDVIDLLDTGPADESKKVLTVPKTDSNPKVEVAAPSPSPSNFSAPAALPLTGVDS